MISVDKIVILTMPGYTHKKKQSWIDSLSQLPWKAPLEIYETPQVNDLDAKLASCRLELSKFWTSLAGREMSTRDKCMAIGHWMVWHQVYKENIETILILEDNFKPASAHYHVLDTEEGWEMIYLGRKSLSVDTPLSGGLVKPGYSHGSFAYLIKKDGLEKLINSGYDQHVVPVSEMLSIMHGSFPVQGLPEFFSGRLRVLALMKDLISEENVEAAPVDNNLYRPLHPQLFEAFGSATPGWIKKYVNPQLVAREFDLICDEPIDNVYSFPLFTPAFCSEIIEEAEHYGHWTNYRYKDHPSIDMMLSSFGFNEIYSWVMKEYVYPLFYYKYQLQGDSLKKLVSQNFIVRYLAEQQGHLGLHNDGSHISMVVTLNTAFEGGGTFFPKFKKLIRHDQPGYASIHPGFIGYLHGARPVISGKRYIVASFFFLEQ